MSPSNLQVSLLEPNEAEQYTLIRHTVFHTTINNILYSRGPASPKTLNHVTTTIRDAITANTISYLKCTDLVTGTIIAGARWRLLAPKDPAAQERTWQEVDADLTVAECYDESDPALFAHFYDLSNANKREIMGTRPYWVLDTLVTLPQHERRGAGAMLVNWGCDRADEMGVEAYVEASVMGAPLYARFGFQPIKEMTIEVTKFGGKEDITLIIMLRPAIHTRTR